MLFGAGGFAYGVAELLAWPIPRVDRKWQVPRVWLTRWSGPRVYLAFGLLLGVGFMTASPFAAFTWLLGLEFATASPVAAASIGAAYGLGRSVATVFGQLELARVDNEPRYVRAAAGRTVAWRPILAAASLAVGAIWVGAALA